MCPVESNNERIKIAFQLSHYGTDIEAAYLGAIYALQDDEHPHRLTQFVHSLRQVIDLLAKCGKSDKCEPLNKRTRPKYLVSLIDPLDHNGSCFGLCMLLSNDYSYLSTIAHDEKIICQDEAEQKLLDVEERLNLITESQISIINEIDAILSQTPSKETVDQLLKLIILPVNIFLIVNHLPKNWFVYMKRANFFSDPKYFYEENIWPQSNYLIKCIDEFPNDILEIIMSFDFKPNFLIYLDFLTCAINLPINDIKKLGKKILCEQWYNFIDDYIFADKYINLAEKLYLDGEYDLSIELLYNAFKPKSTPKNFNDILKSANILSPIVRDIFNDNLITRLPKFHQKNPKIIKLLIDLLDDYVQLNKYINSHYKIDYTWESIQKFSQISQSEIISIFITCVKNYFDVIKNDPIKLKYGVYLLHQKNSYEFHELILYAYAQSPEIFKDEIQSYILIHFNNVLVRGEYYNLLKTVFKNLPVDIQQKICQLINKGFHIKEFERIKQQGLTDEITKTREKQWKLYYFKAIKDDLNEFYFKIYSQLDNELGTLEHDVHQQSDDSAQSVTKSTSFENKNIDEIFDIVSNLKIIDGDSDIIVNTFRKYVENNPVEYSNKSLDLKDAHIQIQYALIAGLNSKLNKNIDWVNVLKLIKHIISPIYEANNLTYVNNLTYIYWLIENGLKNDTVNFDLNEQLWEIIDMLVVIGTRFSDSYNCPNNNYDCPSELCNCKYDDCKYPDKTFDSFYVSNNHINGLSFLILCHYAIWCRKHNKNIKSLESKVKIILDNYLDNKFGEYTISRHAVLGLFFVNLYYLDQNFAEKILKTFPGINIKIAFWEGYVNWTRLSKNIFNVLFPLYKEFLNGNSRKKIKYIRTRNYAIEHLTLAYFYDLKNSNDVFRVFLLRDDEESIKHCIRYIQIIIKDKNLNPEFNIEKFDKLWSDELFLKYSLNGWFHNSPLPKERNISLYFNYLKNHPGKFDIALIDIDRLRDYTSDFPLDVLNCIEILFIKQKGNYIISELKPILEILIKKYSDDKEINNKLKYIIDKAIKLRFDWIDLLKLIR